MDLSLKLNELKSRLLKSRFKRIEDARKTSLGREEKEGEDGVDILHVLEPIEDLVLPSYRAEGGDTSRMHGQNTIT